MGVLLVLHHAPELAVEDGTDLVGRFQGRSRRGKHVDLGRTFVERREEVTAQTSQDARRHGHRHGRHAQNTGNSEAVHTQPDDRRRGPLQATQQESVPFRPGRLFHPAEQVVRQHRGDRQGHDQRCQDRHDVGHAERGEQTAFHPGQGEQRDEHEDHDHRPEHD